MEEDEFKDEMKGIIDGMLTLISTEVEWVPLLTSKITKIIPSLR